MPHSSSGEPIAASWNRWSCRTISKISFEPAVTWVPPIVFLRTSMRRAVLPSRGRGYGRRGGRPRRQHRGVCGHSLAPFSGCREADAAGRRPLLLRMVFSRRHSRCCLRLPYGVVSVSTECYNAQAIGTKGASSTPSTSMRNALSLSQVQQSSPTTLCGQHGDASGAHPFPGASCSSSTWPNAAAPSNASSASPVPSSSGSPSCGSPSSSNSQSLSVSQLDSLLPDVWERSPAVQFWDFPPVIGSLPSIV